VSGKKKWVKESLGYSKILTKEHIHEEWWQLMYTGDKPFYSHDDTSYYGGTVI
jgi:hypothetical protein